MEELGKKGIVRRRFFQDSGMALLAGYAFTHRIGLAQTVESPNSDFQSVVLNTHDYVGEIQERLDLTRDYRAVGVRDEDTIIWFWIGSHSDYERLLSNLS